MLATHADYLQYNAEGKQKVGTATITMIGYPRASVNADFR
jgi:hypothetical protein